MGTDGSAGEKLTVTLTGAGAGLENEEADTTVGTACRWISGLYLDFFTSRKIDHHLERKAISAGLPLHAPSWL